MSTIPNISLFLATVPVLSILQMQLIPSGTMRSIGLNNREGLYQRIIRINRKKLKTLRMNRKREIGKILGGKKRMGINKNRSNRRKSMFNLSSITDKS